MTEWGELDFLIVDMPPGTGDLQMTLTQSVSLSGAVLVTTPHTLSVADLVKGATMFRTVDVPVLAVVENMSYFTCDAGKRYQLFGVCHMFSYLYDVHNDEGRQGRPVNATLEKALPPYRVSSPIRRRPQTLDVAVAMQDPRREAV